METNMSASPYQANRFWRCGLNPITSALIALSAMAVMSVQVASAADIKLEPELVERLKSLKPLYPLQGPASVLGDDSPYASSPGEDSGQLDFAELNERPVNAIRISGRIDKGDSEKLKSVLQAENAWIEGIVFDSPGGNFLEGFRLAEEIRYVLESQDPNLGGVYVLKDGQCLSACAIAFALSVDLVHPSIADARFVERGAELGFHMGLLPKEKADQTGRVGDILNLSYDIMAEFNRLLAGGANPPKLLAGALGHRTQDSFYLLTGGLKTWNLGFTPVSGDFEAQSVSADGLGVGAVSQICTTLLLAGRVYRDGVDEDEGLFHSGSDEASRQLTDIVSATGSRHIARGTHGSFSCHAHLTNDGRVRLSVWRGERQCSSGGDDFVTDWCAVEPRATNAINLALLSDALGCGGGRFQPPPEWLEDGRAGTVKRDVNMRQAPSLEAAKITTLSAGSSATITDCSLVDDSQGIWFEIESAADGVGWVSARFIHEHFAPILALD